MPNNISARLSDSCYYTVVYFEKCVRGHKSKFYTAGEKAFECAEELSKDSKYHGVHIIKTEHFYFTGSKED